MKRVLVTWGSKNGGTEGIGRIIGEVLRKRGFEVVMASAEDVTGLETFEAVIIGGALYANRWPANVRRFVRRNVERLRKVPVWLYSSGPLDDSADRTSIPAPTQIDVLAERIGAKGHVTFGGQLDPNVKGFPARAMAETKSGDWRNPDRIQAWATELAAELPGAIPGRPVDHAARSIPRLVVHGVVGWAACVAIMGVMLWLTNLTVALVIHAIAATLVFAALAHHYFGARGSRDPLATALTWTAMVVILDLVVVAGGIDGSLEMFTSIAGSWLPFTLIFFATWATGGLMSTLPWPKPAK